MVRPVRRARPEIPEDSGRTGTVPGKMESVQPPASRRVLQTTGPAKAAVAAGMFARISLMAAAQRAALKEAACTGR